MYFTSDLKLFISNCNSLRLLNEFENDILSIKIIGIIYKELSNRIKELDKEHLNLFHTQINNFPFRFDLMLNILTNRVPVFIENIKKELAIDGKVDEDIFALITSYKEGTDKDIIDELATIVDEDDKCDTFEKLYEKVTKEADESTIKKINIYETSNKSFIKW